jgi:ankyrin repeat protein
MFKTIAEVKRSIPDSFKDESDLIESVYEINDETIGEVLNKISEANIRSILNVIEHALRVRINKTAYLLTLLSLLSKKFDYSVSRNKYINALLDQNGIKKWNWNGNPRELVEFFPVGTVEKSIIEDNINDFNEHTANASFNPKTKIKTKDPINVVNNDNYISYIQLMALFGSKKCFKYAVSTEEYDLDDTAKYAVAGGDIEIIHILEQNGVSFDNCFEQAVKYHREDICEWLLLHHKCEEIRIMSAIEYHNIDIFMYLLLSRTNVSKSDIDQCLVTASRIGHLEVVKYLYDQSHADVEARDMIGGYTPLIFASEKGHIEIVKYLCEHCHANVLAQDQIGKWTPIIFASINRHPDVVKYLYQNYYANNETKPDIVKIIRNHCVYIFNIDTVKFFCGECKQIVETKDNMGMTPIIAAAEKGQLEVVKYLYEEHHADIEAKDNDGRTPIMAAAEKGQLEVIEYLHKHCNADIEAKDNDGRTPIMIASRHGRLEVIEYLHKQCHADVEAKDNKGMTPIMAAAENGRLEVIKYLHKHCNADIEAKDNEGRTLLMIVPKNVPKDVIRHLREYMSCNNAKQNKIESNDEENFG